MQPLRRKPCSSSSIFYTKCSKISNICIIQRIVQGDRPWSFHISFTQVGKYLKMYFLLFSSDTQTTNCQNFRLRGSIWNMKKKYFKILLDVYAVSAQRETVICQTVKVIFLVNLCWKWSLSRMAHLSLLVRPFYLTNWYSSTCSEYATHFSSEQHRTKWNANIVRQIKTNG